MDRSDIPAVFAILQATYQTRFVATDTTAMVWAELLADVPVASVLKIVKAHAATDEWPPTIASIRNAWAEQVCRLPDVESAIAEVRALASQPSIPGWDDLPYWMKPVVDAAGGWHALRTTTSLGVVLSSMRRAFDAYRDNALSEANTGALGLNVKQRPALGGAEKETA